MSGLLLLKMKNLEMKGQPTLHEEKAETVHSGITSGAPSTENKEA